jgi:inner membrane protein
MACAVEHATFNLVAVAAACATVQYREGRPVDGTAVVMGAAAAALPSLPDVLEPALHPNHRQFFHSVAFALAVAYGIRRVYVWDAQTDWDRLVRAALLVGGAAYLGHLARDAFTTKGLPLV